VIAGIAQHISTTGEKTAAQICGATEPSNACFPDNRPRAPGKLSLHSNASGRLLSS